MPPLLATTALPAFAPAILSRTAPVALPDTGSPGEAFALALDALVPPGIALPGKGNGKAVAAGGKDLPVADAGTDTEDDDALLTWLPGQPVPLPDPSPLPGITFTVVPDGAEAEALTPPDSAAFEAPIAEQTALPGESSVAEVADFAADTCDSLTALPTRSATVPAQAEPRIGGGDAATPETRIARAIGVAAPEHQPAPLPNATQAAAPAAQVFAAALAAPLADPVESTARTVDPVVIEAQATRAAETQRTSVQAMTQADQAPLDLSREEWTGKMIDRIATLRDAAEAADTRIRLAPEHLGSVEVSIRRDGDRLHVHFNAETPATRHLLAEAAPRLAELAESRGVKLGQTSVGGGTGGQDGRQDSPPSHSNRPARPASAAPATATPAPSERIA
ncbi:flagellar hook-length control protein FliK [Sphingomonas suaedae]|uniref:Flagellar hook-length control protein FliK n=1 Tax=Sphingomonas suaedae TaxID=2599297 RepID=A0A518RIB2_9SPHN|nr:flagellar hook-length control protein FliK [Sphingomonas suaedae]QDX27206.1 flagellar hook-length control protein FliK [Sphingomonas suaedae]